MLGKDNFVCVCAVHVNFGTLVVTGRGAATPAVRTAGVPAGSFEITLENPTDNLNAQYICQRRSGTIAAGSINTTFNVLDTSDAVKTVQVLIEGVAGAASALADCDFDFFVYRIL